MNITEVGNERLIIWMKKKGLEIVPSSFWEYMGDTSIAAEKYKKENNLTTIIDQEDFTEYLKENI